MRREAFDKETKLKLGEFNMVKTYLLKYTHTWNFPEWNCQIRSKPDCQWTSLVTSEVSGIGIQLHLIQFWTKGILGESKSRHNVLRQKFFLHKLYSMSPFLMTIPPKLIWIRDAEVSLPETFLSYNLESFVQNNISKMSKEK